MINVVVPLAGNLYFDSAEYFYPKPLIEIRGTPIIQRVIESLNTLPKPHRFIFVVNREDDRKFHLRDTFSLLTNGQCQVVTLDGPSKGAACSVLMAIAHIDNEHPLVIANGDQIFHLQLSTVIDTFKKKKVDAGVISFDSVHPRWSYVRTDDSGRIVEAAEKRPISRNAVAGFYYFARGQDFVRLAMRNIEKGQEVNGQFFIAPVMNEFVLEDRPVGLFPIQANQFRSFYSIQKIEEAQREAG